MNTPNPNHLDRFTHPDPRVNQLAAVLHGLHDERRVHPDYDFDCESLAEKLLPLLPEPVEPKGPALPASWDARLPQYPSAADYWWADHVIDRERGHLRRELMGLSIEGLRERWGTTGRPGRASWTRPEIVNAIIDSECPRAWLDRRLAALR